MPRQIRFGKRPQSNSNRSGTHHHQPLNSQHRSNLHTAHKFDTWSFLSNPWCPPCHRGFRRPPLECNMLRMDPHHMLSCPDKQAGKDKNHPNLWPMHQNSKHSHPCNPTLRILHKCHQNPNPKGNSHHNRNPLRGRCMLNCQRTKRLHQNCMPQRLCNRCML